MEDKKVLIVGGGLEGVKAALEQAEAGSHVTVLEKFPTLGAERIPRDRLIKPEEAFVNPDLGQRKVHRLQGLYPGLPGQHAGRLRRRHGVSNRR